MSNAMDPLRAWGQGTQRETRHRFTYLLHEVFQNSPETLWLQFMLVIHRYRLIELCKGGRCDSAAKMEV